MRVGFLLVAILLTACGLVSIEDTCERPNPGPLPRSVNPVQVGKGTIVGPNLSLAPGAMVVDSQEAWSAFVEKLKSMDPTVDLQPSGIDFRCYVAIVALDERRTVNGHTIDVLEVTEYADSVVVLVKRLQQYGTLPLVVNIPYHVVGIPRTGKPVVFTDGCAKPYSGPFPRLIPLLSAAEGLITETSDDLKQNLVIRDMATWSYWVTTNDLFDSNHQFTLGAPGVDFDCEMIILSVDKAYGYAGHAIEILSVVEENTRILVTIKRSDLGSGLTVSTQPFHLVKVPKVDKEVVFEE